MPKGIVANRSPYDGRHGFSKDLIEVCTTWNLGHPKSSPNPNKDALEFNLIRDVILSDYAELRKTVVGLGFPVVAEIWQKIQNCLQKIRREQSGAHAKTVKTWKERSKKKRDEEKGVAGSAYDTYLKKSKKSKKKKHDEEKGVAGSAYDTSLKKKVKDRALAVRCASPASRQVISLNPRSPSGSPLSHLYQPQKSSSAPDGEVPVAPTDPVERRCSVLAVHP
jgi:hypothetical protein